MRDEVLQQIRENKIIAIIRNIKSEKLLLVADALLKGGIRLLEVTYDSKGNVSDEETAENISKLVKAFQGEIYIGAGTVLTEKQVELLKEAGGEFAISPDARENVIKKTRELGMVSIPGALTPTEIQTAHLAGADFVKLFPISSLGSSYVKAVRAPLSHIEMLAVGGITENNIAEYLSVGISGFGIGANLVNKKYIENDDYEIITSKAKNYVAALQGN